MNTQFDVEEVRYLINKWFFWKGMAIGGFITLVILATIGLLLGK